MNAEEVRDQDGTVAPTTLSEAMWRGNPPGPGEWFTVVEVRPRWVAGWVRLERDGWLVTAKADAGGGTLYVPVEADQPCPEEGDVVVWQAPGVAR